MSTLVLRARWVMPVATPAIDGGYVAVFNGRIASVGASRPDGVIEDLGDVVLMPGLVNAHTHLEFSDLAAPLGRAGTSLPEWIRLVIAERRRSDGDAAHAISAGLAESLAAGVTTVGEIATAPAGAYLASATRPTTVLLQEAIGFSAQRVDSVYADVERRLMATPTPAGVSPHAPYTVHPRLVERLVGLAAARQAPAAMHMAESQEELDLLATGMGAFRELLEERSMWDSGAIAAGLRPLDYLRMLSAAPRALVIHGNYLAVDEIEFIAAWRETMSVVYCPRTHAWFGHPPYPLEAMLAAGIRVALGTDSRASNPDLSLLAEMRFAAKQFPSVASETWIRMATSHAADALGLGDQTGALAPGLRADLVALPWSGGKAVDDVVYGSATPSAVWVGGAATQLSCKS